MSLALLQAAAVVHEIPPDVWGLVGRLLTTLLTVGGGVLLFTWRAIGRAWFCAMLAHCETDVKAAIERLFRERIVTVDAAVDAVSVHADQIEGLEASIEAQGKALSDSLKAAIERQTESMERIADSSTRAMQDLKTTLEKVHDEASENTAAIAKVAGFLEAKGWTGAERRSRKRGDA